MKPAATTSTPELTSTSASTAGQPTAIPALPVDHLVIAVSSLEVSLRYYAVLLAALGYERASDHQWSDGAGVSLKFVEAHEGSRPYERYGPGMNHLGFRARTQAQLDHVRAAMASAGFDIPEVQCLGGAVALFVPDPDGIRFELPATRKRTAKRSAAAPTIIGAAPNTRSQPRDRRSDGVADTIRSM